MLFELLDRSHVLDLFSYVLLEYKILFFSKHPAVLTMVTEALLSLIFPFRWHHVYIPVLPLQLLDLRPDTRQLRRHRAVVAPVGVPCTRTQLLRACMQLGEPRIRTCMLCCMARRRAQTRHIG